MQNRKTSAILISLYLLPWGIQCLVTNILPIYIGELPFATESTIGLIPGHCCSTVDLHDKIYVVDGDKVIDRIAVTARTIGR